jgi:Ca2+/H+ antiporter
VRWLLVFVPITIFLEHAAADRLLLIFLAAALAIVPLAGWMGRATEHLAARGRCSRVGLPVRSPATADPIGCAACNSSPYI